MAQGLSGHQGVPLRDGVRERLQSTLSRLSTVGFGPLPEPDGRPSRAHTDMPTEEAPAAPRTVSLSEPLLTADDVAALLAVPRSSVYEYARRLHDPLPSIPVGRHRRFHRSAIEAWLARLA